MSEWFDNSEFWMDISPLIFNESSREKARTEVGQGLDLIRPKKGARVLDIPCGLGRHALEFARLGFRVTAVDLMPFFLDHARGQALDQGLKLEFVQEDMRSFVRPDDFDLIWNFFSSFGYFSAPRDDEKFLANAWRSLSSGGSLVLEMSSRDHAAGFWKTRERFVHPPMGDTILIEEGRLADDRNSIFLHWRIEQGTDTREHSFFLRLYSESQMRNLMEKVGFSRIEILGDMSGRPFSPDSERMVVLAQK